MDPRNDGPNAGRGEDAATGAPTPAGDDQSSPEVRTATGARTGADRATRSQQGEFLTTSQGLRLRDSDHSLKAGRRGPTLLQDHHLREKITHFDHERIPERVVHARGAAAHGVFESYGTAADLTVAPFLAAGVTTPVFTRFSTVLGSRGSADAVRDTRGFATKFYTPEGTFDLVGNNMPVFFIQDGIKFPDVVHAAKPHPDREIPQAQSAHDTFWDFVSLHTEAQHHTMWNMSDRGIPRSYRMMEGFGVHTFRLVAADGSTCLVKFHWKPVLGVHSLTWEEAQIVNGADPDFHRRDLADAIEAGHYPQWELGLQVMPDTPEEEYAGVDLLDPTKIVPEELVEVRPVGRLTLNANPTNFFAETEQVAFHPGHLPPGIDVTNDPLLQARLFSYIDTQITRLGGPNFSQIPVNRPHAPVNDMLRDGFHQHAVHAGEAPYTPNSMDGGCPFFAGSEDVAFEDIPVPVPESVKERANPASFEDHFSQVRLFWLSMTPVEKEHIVRAYSFELNKCRDQDVQRRQLECLANIDPVLCQEVAKALGLPAPAGTVETADVDPSPALSQVGQEWPTDGRIVGIVVGDDVEEQPLTAAVEAVRAVGGVPAIVAPAGGEVHGEPVRDTYATTRSVLYDAVLLLSRAAPAADALRAPGELAADAALRAPGELAADAAGQGLDDRIRVLVDEAWRHAKAIGASGGGAQALGAAGIAPDGAGIVVADDASHVADGVMSALRTHRVWDRFPTSVA